MVNKDGQGGVAPDPVVECSGAVSKGFAWLLGPLRCGEVVGKAGLISGDIAAWACRGLVRSGNSVHSLAHYIGPLRLMNWRLEAPLSWKCSFCTNFGLERDFIQTAVMKEGCALFLYRLFLVDQSQKFGVVVDLLVECLEHSLMFRVVWRIPPMCQWWKLLSSSSYSLFFPKETAHPRLLSAVLELFGYHSGTLKLLY